MCMMNAGMEKVEVMEEEILTRPKEFKVLLACQKNRCEDCPGETDTHECLCDCHTEEFNNEDY